MVVENLGIPGIDLEFEDDEVKYIVSIKSGPNWGNKGQIDDLKKCFTSAKKVLRTSGSKINVVAVNGCCYGRNTKYDRGEYFKYCGQKFWEFISGDTDLYVELIEPLGHNSRERNDDFKKLYSNKLNLFDKEFGEGFLNADGSIGWEKLIRFNSAIHQK
jgi:hypothetical protein